MIQHFVIHKNGDRYSVITSQGIVCHNVPREWAEEAIRETGFDDVSILDKPSPPELYRATLACAVACELSDLDERLDSLPQSDEVEDIRRRLDVTHEHVCTIREELLRQRKAAELLWYENRFVTFVDQCVAVHVGRGQSDASVRPIVLRKAWATPIGKELLEARERLK